MVESENVTRQYYGVVSLYRDHFIMINIKTNYYYYKT